MIIDIILIVIVVALMGGLFLVLHKRNSGEALKELMKHFGEQSEKLSSLSEQNKEIREELDKKLTETNRVNQEQFGQTSKIIRDISYQSGQLIKEVTERLTKLDETNKQIVGFSSQLQNLQDILQNPKQRGVLGEYYLEETLKNVLPPTLYQMQYDLGEDEGTGNKLIVDAVVFIKDKIIPIDAKFSLENYRRLLDAKDDNLREKIKKQFKIDLKSRINETSKYVRPDKKTLEFAFMFIPSESIYYDLLVNRVGASDLIEYAFREKKVIIVSPVSFLAYLQTVWQGLKAMQIEEKAQEIKKNIEKLGKHINKYDDFLQKLGNSMSATVNHYNNAYREFKKIDKDIIKITGHDSHVELLQVSKPKE